MATTLKRSLVETEPISANDQLVSGHVVEDDVYVTGTGEFNRGDVLVSTDYVNYTKATEASIKTAKSICIMSGSTIEGVTDSMIAEAYFEGEFTESCLNLPCELTDEIKGILREHRLYVR